METKSENCLMSSSLEKARDFIHLHYWEKIPIDKLAKIACCSKGHFQREFLKKFNLTPVEYINDYRMMVARNLLRASSYSCAQIAEKVGINDIFYFSKMFKNIPVKACGNTETIDFVIVI